MKDDTIYLLHIRDAIDRIFTYTTDGESAFKNDLKTQDAVIRNFEIIGEATKKLSDTLKTKHPDIPWRKITGMRDRLIHDYFGVSLNIVWDTIINFLPELKKKIEGLLKNNKTNI